jgi:hypothetical protein
MAGPFSGALVAKAIRFFCSLVLPSNPFRASIANFRAVFALLSSARVKIAASRWPASRACALVLVAEDQTTLFALPALARCALSATNERDIGDWRSPGRRRTPVHAPRAAAGFAPCCDRPAAAFVAAAPNDARPLRNASGVEMRVAGR